MIIVYFQQDFEMKDQSQLNHAMIISRNYYGIARKLQESGHMPDAGNAKHGECHGGVAMLRYKQVGIYNYPFRQFTKQCEPESHGGTAYSPTFGFHQ